MNTLCKKKISFATFASRMRRTFFQNLIFLVLLNIIIKPLWVLGIDRSVQNILGESTYGIYFALSALTMMFSIVADFGITYYNNRQIAREPLQASTMLPHIVMLKIGLSVLYLLLTFGMAIFTGISNASMSLLILLALNQIILSFIIYLRSNISALHYFKTDSLLSITDKVLMLLFFGAFLWSEHLRVHFTIDWFVYGQSICYGFTLLLALLANLKLLHHIRLRIHTALLKDIWGKSYPYALVILFMAIYTRSDAWLLERINGANEAGFYASAYRLLDAINQFGYLFAALLLPIFSRLLGNRQDTKPLLNTSFRSIFLFATFVVLCAYVSAQDVMKLLYQEATAESGELLSLLLCSLFGSFGVYIFGTWLAAAGKLHALNTITGIAAFCSIVMNLILIPKYGALGAAATAILINASVAIAEAIVVMRHTDSHFSMTSFLTYFLFILFAVSSAWSISHYTHLTWMWNILLCAATTTIWAFVTGLIRWTDMALWRQWLAKA